MFYVIFIIGLLLAIINKKGITPKIYASLLVLLAAFRYGCGADYFSYGGLYSWTNNSVITEFFNPSDSQEIGFRLFAALFKQLNLPYQVFIAIIAAINIYFLYKICIKYTKNPTLSLLIYYVSCYFVWTYSSLRQGLVLTIGVYYLLESIKDRKRIKFIIITILLSLIHASAFILIVLYIVSEINLKKYHLILLLLAGILFNLMPLGDIVNQLSPSIPIIKRISHYIDTTYSVSDFFDFKTIARVVFLIIAFMFYDTYCKDNPLNKKIMNIYIFSFVIYFFFKFAELTAARLAIYGKVLDIIIFCNIYYTLKRKDNKLIYASFIFILLTTYFFKELNTMEIQSNLTDTIPFCTPYVNIFNKGKYFFENALQRFVQ